MTPKLTQEQQHAVDAHHGCVPVEGPQGSYILMRMDIYRELLGIGTATEYEASLEAIRSGWSDVQNRRTRPVNEFFAQS